MLRLAALLAFAQSPQSLARPALMPLPANLTWTEGRMRLDSTVQVTVPAFSDDRLDRAIRRFRARLEARIAQPLGREGAGGTEAGGIAVVVKEAGQAVQTPEEDESYALEVTGSGARLEAATVVGALRGLETLLQLVTPDADGFSLPAVSIADRPRFPWRGLLLDVARHWMPPEAVRRTLDGMAAVKLNVLHWHLTDDQGFRLESRRHPKLHQLGSDGLYYTQDEVREIVAYARDRGIRVVPEFDLPGHATSWFVGYPEYASAPGPYRIERRFGVFDPAFDPTREATYDFLEGFIEEMAALFPDPYWHIGGDEVTGKHWNQNPRIRRFKRERTFQDNETLQAYFSQRLSRILERHHRRMIGWDEILHPGLPAETVVQSWRGLEYLGRAVRAGYRTILSAPWYLDHMKSAEEHYLADPLPAEAGLTPEEAARVLGGEACMWAEHVSAETVDSRIWPRLAAIAERFWSPAAVRDVDDMYRRLSAVSVRLEELGLGHEAHYARMLRRIVGRREIEAARKLLEITQPVTFGDRTQLQRTTQLTPLTQLVDAARPDPWLRYRLVRLARDHRAGQDSATRALEAEFRAWQALPDQIAGLARQAPVLGPGVEAARGSTGPAGRGSPAAPGLRHGIGGLGRFSPIGARGTR
jgi:hexosaminidase